MEFGRAARLMHQLPEKSRVSRAIHPENEWGWKEILLNNIQYELQILQWMKTEDATKRNPQNRPEKWLPEFIKNALPDDTTETEAHDLDEIKDILSRPRQNVTVGSNE